MGILQCFFVALLSNFFLSITAVHAQDQSGFISIDCGLPDNASYTDPVTKLNYNSDEVFIDTGISRSISSEFSGYAQWLQYVRSFPEGDRNCYKVGVDKGVKYLIRAIFMYGNYDGLNKMPQFDIHLGPNKWYTVGSSTTSHIFTEMIHVTTRNYIFVCLVNTGLGTPFISTLELRPLNNAPYNTISGSLLLYERMDFGSNSTTNDVVRFPDDIYDRFWLSYNFHEWSVLFNSQADEHWRQNDYKPPNIVMNTAVVSDIATEPLNFWTRNLSTASQYYVYMHFAELAVLQANQSRIFNICMIGEICYGPVIPSYLSTNTVFAHSSLDRRELDFSLAETEGSNLPPLINAIETYGVVELTQVQSDQGDVDAITNIKSAYNIKRNWRGDPCVPQHYLWEGLNCNYEYDRPRIISLDLSSSGLVGDITPYISELTLLQTLDLSNNSLTGTVPDYLSHLPSLKVLNISGNLLTGSVPSALLERSNKNLLVLSAGENPNLCASISCKKEKKKFLIPIGASIAAVLIIAAFAIGFWRFKREKWQASMCLIKLVEVLPAKHIGARTNKSCKPLNSKYQQATYGKVLKITNNFQRVLGKGGFGTVYHGFLDGNEVAVKMLSPSSAQGCTQFQAEVKLLLTVHHRNLTSLVCFCDEGTRMGLIYEYMANGDLEKHLSDTNTKVLSWERRLQIAVDAAKGLEYLHSGCRPPIMHRDVKTSNILLNDKLQAKLADFGLSRSFPIEGGTHVSTTNVVGTPGYLDPEYSATFRFTEKSDVYSFGIVLLRIITGKPVLSKSESRNVYVSQWARTMLANGDINSIVDPRLNGDFNINSMWKAVEIAMACSSPTSARRPAMLQVVTELNECLAEEIAQRNEVELEGSFGVIVESMPIAR